jgi:hypothetical protein
MNQQPSSLPCWREGVNVRSPVREVLALGYYDGPTDGVLRCADGSVYRFELLTWDPDTQDLRVFGLSRLPDSAWQLLNGLYSRHQAPRWPIWVPSWRDELEKPVEDILKEAGPVEWIVATEDLLGEIARVKRIAADALTAMTDWRAFLELDRDLPARVSPSGE